MKALISIDLDGYRVGLSPTQNGHVVRSLLETWFEAMTRQNMAWLQINPDKPLLYRSGIRYKKDPVKGPLGITELWLDAPAIYRRGYDDCEGLASFLAAELRTRAPNSVGQHCRPLACVKLKTTRYPGLLHAIVYDPQTNMIFDPSRKLGMGKKDV